MSRPVPPSSPQVNGLPTDLRGIVARVKEDLAISNANLRIQNMGNNPALEDYDEKVREIFQNAKDSLANALNARKAREQG